jgi:ubiquinone/menaquinone biosynthesis C-methylase UbiE
VTHCKKLRKTGTINYYRCVGKEKQSNLPDGVFDKIILASTFHEFTFMDEMINDIYKKLKPSGQLYILDAHCLTPTHKSYTVDQTIEILKKHNFSLVKKETKDIHNSSGLYRTVFKKQ